MRFAVEPSVFTYFPGLRLAIAVASGMDNSTAHPAIRAAWESVWKKVREARVYGNSQSHPRVHPWRERFQAIGVSSKKFPTSIEALLRRALKGDEPFFINPFVDFYNTVSLRHVVPAGGFDLAEIGEDLMLRLTREGDHFQALDEDAPAPVPPGEVAYASGHTILTRHFVWRQARTALISPATRDVFLVSEILGKLEAGVIEAVLNDFQQGLRSYFRVEPQLFVVDERAPNISW